MKEAEGLGELLVAVRMGGRNSCLEQKSSYHVTSRNLQRRFDDRVLEGAIERSGGQNLRPHM